MAGRVRMLMDNFLSAKTEGKRSGAFDIAQISDDNFEEYYILFKPLAGIYRDQWQIIHMKTTFGSGTKYTYPLNAPLVKFITNVYHTNISTSGSICLDILKNNKVWMPSYDFSAIIQNIMLLYMEPNNSSPFNGAASRNYVDCERKYKSVKKKGMSIPDEEALWDECFSSFKATADAYASTDLSGYAKWFPQILGREHTAEHVEHIKNMYSIIEAQKIKIAEKKAEREKKSASKKNKRWSKYQKKPNADEPTEPTEPTE